MPVDTDSRLEVEYALNGLRDFPTEYIELAFKWMAFNRAYNDTEQGGDKDKVLSFGDKHEHHWPDIQALASAFVSLECIGGERVAGNTLLKPKSEVKSATLYLRQELGLDQAADPTHCAFPGCRRQQKRVLCNRVPAPAWARSKAAAVLRLVYQVRCSLIHGEKRLTAANPQYARDRELVRLASLVMDQVLGWILVDNE